VQRDTGGTPVEPLTFTFNIASDGETLTIPCRATGTFNAVLDWGDGSDTSEITAYNDADLAHVYATAGEYDVTVTGEFDNIYFNDGGEALKLVDMKGNGSSILKSGFSSFNGCANLATFPLIDTSTWDTCYRSWKNCESLASFPLIDTSAIEYFTESWNACGGLASFPQIDVSQGRTFVFAWRNNSSLVDFAANVFDNWNPISVDANCFLRTWENCDSLSAQSVVNILTSIDTSGVSAPALGVDITIDYVGGDISAAATAITNLKARGWTVTINGVLQ
jgi:hypothetical protein